MTRAWIASSTRAGASGPAGLSVGGTVARGLVALGIGAGIVRPAWGEVGGVVRTSGESHDATNVPAPSMTTSATCRASEEMVVKWVTLPLRISVGRAIDYAVSRTSTRSVSKNGVIGISVFWGCRTLTTVRNPSVGLPTVASA
jgi:hypothetical protein